MTEWSADPLVGYDQWIRPKKDADDLQDFTSMPNLDNVKLPSEQLDKLPVKPFTSGSVDPY